MKKILLFLALCIMFAMNTQAIVRTASVTGNWSNATTWGGTVPNANDDVVINSGVTVTINVNPNNIANVTINGGLQWDATGTGRAWTVTGSFTINSGGVFNCTAPGSATTHTFNYNGTSFTNNGTFNMVNGSNKCNVVVGGSVTQTFSGSNTMTFNKFTLNNTGGKFQIVYGGGNFTPTEINPTKLNVSITTNDSCVIKQGLLVGCAIANSTVSHSFANFKMGSGTTNISSSVSLGGDATIIVNTGMILNDASNSNVNMTVSGSFISPSMTQANAATAFGMQGPNCAGGNSNSTLLTITGDWTMTDIFVFVGSTKLFGGVEPNNPEVTCSGNISWASTETHTINLPFTSDDFYIKTCFFGLFDSQGAFPTMVLDGAPVYNAPKTFNIAFDVFDAEVQESSPLGQTTIAQISESMANWIVDGSWKIVSGASLAIHSDATLTVNGLLWVESNGEIAGSETETEDTSYIPTNGPSISFGSSGVLYVENTSGLGKGLLADASSNVAFKNRTADIDWNLNGISSSGTIVYSATASQIVTDRTYNNFATSGSGTKTLANAITVNGSTAIGASTTLANGGFNVTSKGAVTNDGTHSGSGKIILGGSSNQSLSGSGSEWGNLQLNNSAGATCSSSVATSGTINFTSGILTTTSSAKLSLSGTGNYTGGSSSSYVNGPMSKTTVSTGEFIFPLGKGGNFRQVSVTPSSTSSTTWTAEYVNAAYSNTSSVFAPITSVNNLLYWTVDRSGSANANVKLYWGSEASLADLNGLTVSRFDGTQWTDAGRSATTGTTSSGTITSNVVSIFSPFTLGEANTITTNTISGSPFCPGASVNVPFTSTGTFNAGNVYTAQISNKTGSFSAPVAIGTLSSTANSGTISAIIPTTSKGGTKYRIRVVSSNPVVLGGNNGSNLAVTACGAPTALTTTTITATSATFSWTGVTCAYNYTLEYRVQGNTTWKKKKNLTGTTYTLTGLTANTVYEYAMQTICTADTKSKSSFTTTQTFMTTLRLSSALTSSEQTVLMYPNPATDKVELTINCNENHSGAVKIFNAVGEVMIEEIISLNEGSNQLSLDVSSLTAGIYFVEVRDGDVRTMEKLVKE